jgi:hypothetical protein
LIGQGYDIDNDPFTCTPCPLNTYATTTGAIACTGPSTRQCPAGTGLGLTGISIL